MEVLIRKPGTQKHYEDKVAYCIREVNRLSALVDQVLMLARFDMWLSFRKILRPVTYTGCCLSPFDGLSSDRMRGFADPTGKIPHYVRRMRYREHPFLVPMDSFQSPGNREPGRRINPRKVCGMHRQHFELHYAERIGWLRAAVMGANDGIVSTASLVVGVAAAQVARGDVLIAGMAGLVAGAMSMAAGEYVSVSSQADTEKADLARERAELAENEEFETKELAEIYVKRGLDASLAQQVADQLMKHDALAAHARDELGLSEIHSARPIQAALASAATFAVGAALPLLMVLLSPFSIVIPVVAGSSLVFLALMGGLAARTGGARIVVGAGRVAFWGALAMAATAALGAFFGNVV
jgi:VIT1/CCC1 family predicted Fe2+/Mn2+ transporter